MTMRALAILGLVTACALALAIASSHTWHGDDAVSERGDRFAPAIPGEAQDIAAITIEAEGITTALVREGTDFIDGSGYPVRPEPVRDLIRSLAALTIVEKKTDDPARYRELDLAGPDAETGTGKRIILKTADGTVIENLIIGRADYTVGGGGGGHFVRREDAPQSFLVRGAVKLPFSRAGWFDPELFDIGDAKIVRATLAGGDVTALRLDRRDDALVIADLPSDREANLEKIARIDRSFVPLKLEDVRSATGTGDPGEPVLRFETDDGLIVELRSVETIADNNRWVRISASAGAQEAGDAAEAIGDRVNGYEFRLDTLTSEILSWTLDDLTNPRGS